MCRRCSCRQVWRSIGDKQCRLLRWIAWERWTPCSHTNTILHWNALIYSIHAYSKLLGFFFLEGNKGQVTTPWLSKTLLLIESAQKLQNKQRNSKKKKKKTAKEKLGGLQRGEKKWGVNLTGISFSSQKSEWPECKKLITGTCPAFFFARLTVALSGWGMWLYGVCGPHKGAGEESVAERPLGWAHGMEHCTISQPLRSAGL